MKKFLKIFFCETPCRILKTIHRNVPWVTVFKNRSRNFDLSISMTGVWGLLALYGHKGILKNSSSLKPLVRFSNNFAGIFMGDPFQKKMFAIRQEMWLW